MARKKKSKSQKARERQQRKAQQRQQAASSAAAPDSATAADLAKSGTFLDDLRKEKAAQLLAAKEFTIVDVAAAVGVHRETIRVWQRDRKFAARVAELAEELASESHRFFIARRRFRLANLQERLLQMQRVIDARAAKQTVPAAEGGDTGIVVRQERMIGSGDNAVRVEEFKVDLGLLKEMRETEKQAAQECGDWTEKTELTGAGGGPIRLTLEEALQADRELEEWEAAQADAEPCPTRPPPTDAS